MTVQPTPKRAPAWSDTWDLLRDNYDVIAMVGAQQKVVQRRVIERRQGCTTIWYERSVHLEPGRFGIRFRYRPLKRHAAAAIKRWRPVDPARFSDPLPASVRIEGETRWQSAPEPATPPEQADGLEWPHEYATASNISQEEVWVRLLRALRTVRARGERVAAGPRSCGRDSVAVLAQQTLAGRLDEHVDESFIAPAGTSSQPTARHCRLLGRLGSPSCSQRSSASSTSAPTHSESLETGCRNRRNGREGDSAGEHFRPNGPTGSLRPRRNNAVGAKIKRCGTSGVYFAKSPNMDGFMAVGTDRARIERVIPYYLCDIG